jgi:hypothetical protein
MCASSCMASSRCPLAQPRHQWRHRRVRNARWQASHDLPLRESVGVWGVQWQRHNSERWRQSAVVEEGEISRWPARSAPWHHSRRHHLRRLDGRLETPSTVGCLGCSARGRCNDARMGRVLGTVDRSSSTADQAAICRGQPELAKIGGCGLWKRCERGWIFYVV